MDLEQSSSQVDENHVTFHIKKEAEDYDVYVGVYADNALHTGLGDLKTDAVLSPGVEDEGGVNSDADIKGGWEEDSNHELGNNDKSNVKGEINPSHPKSEGSTGQAVQSNFSSTTIEKQLLDTNLLAVGPVEMKTEKEAFECLRCKMCFLKKAHVTSHSLKPKKKRLYRCTRCVKGYRTMTHLIEHCNLMMHSNSTNSACECLNSTSSLKKHTSGRCKEKLYGCGLCDKVFSRPEKLSKHIAWHTKRKSFFRCSRCRKGLKTECNLWMHVRTHSQEKTFGSTNPEPISSFQVFHANISVNKVKSNRTDKNFECIMCGKDVDYKCMCYVRPEIKMEIKAKRRFACLYCPKDFARLRHLNEHARSHTGAKPYQCSECFQSYVSGCTLGRHMKTHFGVKKFECEYCTRKFSKSGHLIAHIRTHTGEKPFHCSECDKSFVTATHLRGHMRRHTGERPFKCDYCEERFYSSDTLNGHIATHPGKCPFTCLICGKGFLKKHKLTKHCKTHILKRTFQCTMCNKSFKSNSRKQKHFESRHSGESY